jgi:hypothetical protein
MRFGENQDKKDQKKQTDQMSHLKLREFQIESPPPYSEHNSSSSSFKVIELEA